MKVGMVLTGSRGDIQPFLGLAAGLVEAGHEVNVSANTDAAPLMSAAGVKFVPMDLDIRQWLTSPAGQHALMDGTAPALLDSANEWFAAAVPTITEGAVTVIDGADVVVSGLAMDDYTAAICAAHRVPLVLAYVHPWEHTTEYPHALMHPDWLGLDQVSDADIERTHRELEQIHWRGRHDSVNRLRASLGLSAVQRPMFNLAPELGLTALYEYSPLVSPRPADWGANSLVTGYWPLSAQTRERLGEAAPSPALLDWLDAGPAPIFLSFGSMPIMDPAPVVEMAVTASKRAGVRILIGAGWSDMDQIAASLPEQAAMVNDIDHDWLFPRCQGVVHHGGSGTTGTGLTAGRPTFVYSIFLDQPYWGSRVTALGAGGHRRFHELNLDTLTEALTLLSSEDIRANADALGRQMRQEDGVGTAIRQITGTTNAIPR